MSETETPLKNKVKKPSLAGVKIDEVLVKPDFELATKYQEFSSELVKVSLAGIAVVGYFIEHLKLLSASPYIKALVGFGLILLIISTSFSLAHRYFSSDSMAYFLAYLRAKTLVEDKKESFSSEQIALLSKQLEDERQGLKRP